MAVSALGVFHAGFPIITNSPFAHIRPLDSSTPEYLFLLSPIQLRTFILLFFAIILILNTFIFYGLIKEKYWTYRYSPLFFMLIVSIVSLIKYFL